MLAIRDYTSAISINAKDAMALANRGQALTQIGKYSEAYNDLVTAIQLQPRYPAPYANFGYILEQKGQKDLAIKAYQNYLALNPSDEKMKIFVGGRLKVLIH